MELMKRKKSKRVSIGAGAGIAMGLGGALLAWGYRRWTRQSAKAESKGAPSGLDYQSENLSTPEAEHLAEKLQSLDAEGKAGNIPKDLERDPKNVEQSIHPT